ncbi:hypothetical protein MKW92_021478 [Papaver armeniacum]|nr:hypothetical protein MKW92_021478 [Papaver armeniacum]
MCGIRPWLMIKVERIGSRETLNFWEKLHLVIILELYWTLDAQLLALIIFALTAISITPKDVDENQIQFAQSAVCLRWWQLWQHDAYCIQARLLKMEDLTSHLCWELVKKEGYVAIWRKPSNNNCYLGRDADPPLLVLNLHYDPSDDPDNVWYLYYLFSIFF